MSWTGEHERFRRRGQVKEKMTAKAIYFEIALTDIEVQSTDARSEV